MYNIFNIFKLMIDLFNKRKEKIILKILNSGVNEKGYLQTKLESASNIPLDV
jgi:hypothetical protein